MAIGIGISTMWRRGGGSAAPDGNPSDLIISDITDTQANATITINATNADGVSWEYSTDGVNYTEHGTSTGSSYSYTGLTENTLYCFRARNYKGTQYSDYCTEVSDYTYYAMTLTSTGTGAGVSTLKFTTNANQTVKLTGAGRFYTDSGGTTGESTTWSLTTGEIRTIYLKVPSSTSKLLVKVRNIISWGRSYDSGWTSSTNAASIACDISKFIGGITYIYLTGTTNFSGSIAGLTSLVQFHNVGTNTISGSINALTSLVYIYIDSNHSLSGNLGLLTSCTNIRILNNKSTVTYSTHTWPASMVNYRPTVASGSGWSVADISLALIEASATTWTGDKALNLGVNHSSMADTTQGGIWGDFEGETSPSALATALKSLVKTKSVTVTLTGIALPGVSGDGTGFPAGFGDWYRS